MKGLLKTYRYLVAALAFDLIVLAVHPNTGITLFRRTGSIVLEMLGVLPPIFVLLGLLEVWVPRETVIRFLGEKSGFVGISLSFLLGAAAAGPLYAAFPVAATMLRKGARFTNVLILLYAWSTLKLPMFLFETSALGADFSVTRMLINVPGIAALAWLTNLLVGRTEREAIYARYANQSGPA
ncbi:MAG: permease [Clostridia bacterium]|nr:permease [Clostridia bacterium]